MTLNLSYFIDLYAMHDASQMQIEAYMRTIFDSMLKSEAYKSSDSDITEDFFRTEDPVLFLAHKSGKVLADVIYGIKSGEVRNRMLPIILGPKIKSISEQELRNVEFGERKTGNPNIHPNAIFLPKSQHRKAWEILEPPHYDGFRALQVRNAIINSDARTFLPKLLRNIVLTKKAYSQFDLLSDDDKNIVLKDLANLDNYVQNGWTSGDFSINDFSRTTGVDASDESDSTKKDPKKKRYRRFSLPEIGSTFCFLHIKISNTYRIHFYPDKTSKKCHIPYIGKHLPI